MIRVGLVGFGMGSRVFHAPLVSSVEGLELAAVMERTSNKAVERYPNIKVYRSLQDMLADTTLALIVVASPNGTHYALAKEVLSAGKNVVVDKPMTVTSAQAAELIGLAKKQGTLLTPFHNRRWDSDFLTVKKLLDEGSLGRLVAVESRFDRWRPAPLAERLWKENSVLGGGALLDLGPHLGDQALTLFGKPETVSADVAREKDGPGVDDAFTIRLRYSGFVVTLGANSLSLPATTRFHLRGTKGNYLKSGLDLQEAALSKVLRIDEKIGGPAWGQESPTSWGVLHVGIDGGSVSRPVPALVGDYRHYYAGIRDALLGKAPPPVSAVDGWRVARLLEFATESSEKRCEIVCDWSQEPN